MRNSVLFFLLLGLAGLAPSLFAQQVQLAAINDPAMGELIFWDSPAGKHYEVLRSTNILAAAFVPAPSAAGDMEDNQPHADTAGTIFYKDPDAAAGPGARFYRVREVLQGLVRLSILGLENTAQDENGEPMPASSYMQVIWTLDPVKDPIDPTNPFKTTQDDVVLFAQPINDFNAGGGILNRPENSEFSGYYAGGYLYIRVFDIPFPGGGAPTMFGENASVLGPLTEESIDPNSINQLRPAPFRVNQPVN